MRHPVLSSSFSFGYFLAGIHSFAGGKEEEDLYMMESSTASLPGNNGHGEEIRPYKIHVGSRLTRTIPR